MSFTVSRLQSGRLISVPKIVIFKTIENGKPVDYQATVMNMDRHGMADLLVEGTNQDGDKPFVVKNVKMQVREEVNPPPKPKTEVVKPPVRPCWGYE